MRIISKSKLRDFWTKPGNSDVELHLKNWYKAITERRWESPHDIIAYFKDADQVGNGRIVFNIAHNKYRLIVFFRYKIQIGYVRFIGTHKEYDRIKDIKEI
jgi:mRNA interferase HigB